ncbi:MAG TPA: trehalose-phosphatase [Pseudomonadales bacterium]|nr:trehalose-phosphatase [Pseudomonadales bacterium]
MEYIFSSTGIDCLKSQLQRTNLFALDFDGTLAQINPFPDAARMRPSTEALLAQLARREAVVIVSGRGLQDLKRRVSVPNIKLIGNHGIESDVRNYSLALASAEKICHAWKRDLLSILIDSASGLAIDIEDKIYSLSVHYRRSTNYSLCLDFIARAVSLLVPSPRVIHGKAVVNLVPPGSPHKGDAVVDALTHSGLAHGIFVGDDDTDEDVFLNSRADLFTIRVGFDPNSAASFYLRGQQEIERLLSLFLQARLERAGGHRVTDKTK